MIEEPQEMSDIGTISKSLYFNNPNQNTLFIYKGRHEIYPKIKKMKLICGVQLTKQLYQH